MLWSPHDRIMPQFSRRRLRLTMDSSVGLLDLPAEMIQQIACFLPTDKDVANTILVCRRLYRTISPPEAGIWRYRFLRLYDPYPAGMTSRKVMVEYISRQVAFRKKGSFEADGDKRKLLWLLSATTLINETFLHPTSYGKPSLNLRLLERLISFNDFLNRPLNVPKLIKADYMPSYLGVQLCLTHLALRFPQPFQASRQDYDIGFAYGVVNDDEDYHRLFSGFKLDLVQLFHIRNFWKNHLTCKDENSYHSSYKTILPEMMPRAWDSSFTMRRTLGENWIGYHSCIHPYVGMENLIERQTCADFGTHQDEISQLRLSLKPGNGDKRLQHIIENGYPGFTNSIVAGRREWFCGTLRIDNEDEGSQILAYTEDIRALQGGFPGWKRVQLLIYQLNELGKEHFEDSSDEDIELSWYWEECFDIAIAYDLAVIPGGKIMLGRWQNLLTVYNWESGPLILWNTD